MTATDHLATVRRTVSSGERDGTPTKVVSIAQDYHVGVDELWHAITTGERISRWLMPVSGELRLGGRYQLEGNAGGEVLECEPGRRLAVTWEYGDEVSWVVATLAGDDETSTLEVEHVAHVDQGRWDEFGPGAVGIGWDMMLLGLALHLSSGEHLNPEEAVAWSASPDGIRFMTRSNELWRDANIAAGESEADAAAAAHRCIIAYTGADAGPDA
jgi:uncharacterized protein YndB with AHSA1/START domain